MPAIASLKDPKAARKGFCTVFFAFSPNALRLTSVQLRGEGREKHADQTGAIEEKETGHIFLGNALKTSTSPQT